jgi:hypothetical protein
MSEDTEPRALYIRRTYEPLKFLGRLFWVPLQVYAGTPAVSYAPTWEDTGERWAPTVVVRVPFTRLAIGLGVWLDVKPGSIVEIRDEDAEYDAYVAVNGAVPRDAWQAARRQIAAQGLDPDEEMEVMQAMGVFE